MMIDFVRGSITVIHLSVRVFEEQFRNEQTSVFINGRSTRPRKAGQG